MRRINKVQLMPTKQQKKLLKEMMYLSSCVYNMANYEVRQKVFKNEKIPSFHDLQQLIQKKKDYQRLGRSYGLSRLQKYSENVKSYFGLIKSKTQNCVGQGIKVYMDSEAWTSQQCPECGHIHKGNRNDRVFLCRNCQYHGDADVVGAKNILNNGMWSHGFTGRPHQAEAGLLEMSP